MDWGISDSFWLLSPPRISCVSFGPREIWRGRREGRREEGNGAVVNDYKISLTFQFNIAKANT